MKRFLGTLVVAIVAVFVSAALLEFGVRLALGEQVKFPRRVVGAPFGLRINEPNARYRHRSADVSVSFRINGQGMRADRDFAYSKPAGVKRIVSLGDSFTIGYEVEAEETFSSVLESALRAQGENVEVLNAGVSGYSTAEEFLYLERELFRYEPDLVLVSFYGNDLVDNTRTGLFRLEGDRLVEAAQVYVPAGRLGDFLNTNWLFSFLSERSDSFALIKEVATLALKRRMVDENLEQLKVGPADDEAIQSEQRRLTAAIFERIYAATRQRGIPLVIQSIPADTYPEGRERPVVLIEQFPLEYFDVNREGLTFFPAQSVLQAEVGKRLLYYQKSHAHWVPWSHRASGEALARLILAGDLLDR